MPKLPADLPENWTQGQTISPNGTEVGLTEKHGYNYLMKQVNDTQTEVNNINTALTDVAQQATVDEINNKIGTESDADTQPTLFGRLAQLKKVLLEKLAELLTKVTGIDTKIGTIGDSESTDTLFGRIKKILDSVNEKEYVESDTVVATLNSTISGSKGAKVIIKRKAEYSGVVRIKIEAVKGNNEPPFQLVAGTTSNMGIIYNTATSLAQDILNALSSSEGTTVSLSYMPAEHISGLTNMKITTTLSNINIDMHVNKGEYIYLLAFWFSSGCTVTNARLCYDIK